jgi:hypothetical protein
MKLSNLDPLIPLMELKAKLMKLPEDYLIDEEELIEFLSQRRWPERNRRIDRTTFWRWRNDNKIDNQKSFGKLDIVKLCQICDHYRLDGTRNEYLTMVNHTPDLSLNK